MSEEPKVFSKEIFDPEFPLDGPHLVAASAGTGKTHNIQNICARLVMERGLRISQIQVMTFTEAATKELRDRIRGVFANLQRFFANDKKDMDKNEIERLEKLRDCARRNLGEDADEKARIAVSLALLEFDQAAISTIHGFCRRALVRFAFETGSAFRTEFGNDKDADLKRRARDWWRVNRPSITLADLQKEVKALGEKTDWSIDETFESEEKNECLDMAAKIVKRYEQDRPLRETQTFDDLLRSVRKALNDPTFGSILAKRLRDEFKAVIVDEFQDTDPVQYDIFFKAFLECPEAEHPPIFFVGDPKQAIYSFRGADIYTYREAAGNDIPDGRTYRLDKNFRSTERLVRAVNLLFGDEKSDDGKVLRRTFGDDLIPYQNDVLWSDVKGLPIALDEQRPIDDPHPFRIVFAEDKESRHAAVVDAVMKTLAEQRKLGTMVVEKTRNQDGEEEKVRIPFGPRHIVILASHDDGARYRDELRKRGVPVVLQKSGNVFAGETALEFRLVLMAMAGMGGRAQIRAALATSFFQFSASELEEDDSAVMADMVGVFGHLNRVWLKRGFNAAFAALENNERCNLRVRFAALPDGERRLADIFQIVDLATAVIRERGPSPETLVDWITERINASENDEEEKDSEEYARELETEFDAVKIMTVHASKGLEFPVTIVSVSKGKSLEQPYFHHVGNDLRVGSGEDAKEHAKQEADAEKMRLLYVAFTRASMRTIVVAAVSGKENKPENTLLASLLGNARSRGAGEDNPPDSPILWTTFKPSDPPLPNYRPDTPIAPATLCDAEVPRGYSQHRQKGSYSSLSPSLDEDVDGEGGNASRTPGGDADPSADGLDMDANPSHHEEDGIETDEHPIFSIGGGARTGTCWHDILEKLPFDATDEMIREGTLRSMRLHGLARGDEKKVDEDVATVSEMIRKTLDWPIVSPSGAKFKLSDVPMDRRFSEWEFDFSSAESVKTTEAIATILKDEWKDDPAKALFLKAAEKWNRQIPKGFLVGFLDLLFEHDGFFYVVDWKSNKVGGKAANFAEEGIKAEMAKEGYFFQYLLYSAVLHRFLKETLGSAYSWERNFGGVRYYFLRGIAAEGNAPVFEDRPGKNMLDRLCDALGLKD